MDDERITWVRAAPGRTIVQLIEPMPEGFSVTTQWKQGDVIERQDVEVAIRRAPAAGGAAAKLN